MLTPNEHRETNGFTWEPIREVAILFAGIFACIIPVLAMLQAGTRRRRSRWLPALIDESDGLPNEVAYFWLTGVLSAFLDNAPTYLVFFELAGGDAQALMGPLAPTLAAISMGAVYMGALTYIGNAPNLMIYAIAEERGVKMPSFVGYMLWASLILLPGLLAAHFRFPRFLAAVLREARLAARGLAARACRLGRQRHDHLDLEQGALAREARAAERGRGGKRGGVEIAGAHLAQDRQVRDVGEVAVDLDHVLEARRRPPPAPPSGSRTPAAPGRGSRG